MTPTAKPHAITESTTVSIRLLLTMLAILIPVGGAWWHMTSQLKDIVHELRLLRMDVSDNSTGKLASATWESWIRELAALNPDMRIPD